MALSKLIGSISPAGIASWRIKDLTRPDAAYCAFLTPRDGSIVFSTLGVADAYNRTRNHAYQIIATAKVPIVRTQASMLDLLGTIGKQEIAHAITLQTGDAFESALDTANPSWGFKWKMVSDPSLDSDWYLEITADRKMTRTAAELIFTDTPVATGEPNASDTLYAMRAIAVTDIAPAGITKVEVGTSYGDVVEFVRNGRFTAELLTTQDDLGRSHGFAIKCDFEAECMQADLGQEFDDIIDTGVAVASTRLTFANGSVFTGAASLGFSFEYRNERDANDISVLKLSGSGIVLTSAWAGLWS